MDWTGTVEAQIQTNSSVLSSTSAGWYVVAGSAPEVPLDAKIEIDLAGRGAVEITQPGEFYIPVYVSAGAAGPVTVSAYGTATGWRLRDPAVRERARMQTGSLPTAPASSPDPRTLRNSGLLADLPD